ncbi:MAG: hypothetical protein E6Z80_19390, partial [Citrobacter freundii]|nr:hypothetical protein [Citrobacter freundii]
MSRVAASPYPAYVRHVGPVSAAPPGKLLASSDFPAKVFTRNSGKSAMSKSTRATISDVAKAAKTGKTSISRYL